MCRQAPTSILIPAVIRAVQSVPVESVKALATRPGHQNGALGVQRIPSGRLTTHIFGKVRAPKRRQNVWRTPSGRKVCRARIVTPPPLPRGTHKLSCGFVSSGSGCKGPNLHKGSRKREHKTHSVSGVYGVHQGERFVSRLVREVQKRLRAPRIVRAAAVAIIRWLVWVPRIVHSGVDWFWSFTQHFWWSYTPVRACNPSVRLTESHCCRCIQATEESGQ